MARAGLQLNIGQPLNSGGYSHSASGHDGQTSLAAAIATAVADGATPTQAHVTAINTAYAASVVSDIVLTYDTTKITTLNQMRWALAALEFQARAAGLK